MLFMAYIYIYAFMTEQHKVTIARIGYVTEGLNLVSCIWRKLKKVWFFAESGHFLAKFCKTLL